MPIILEDITSAAATKRAITPKFFRPELTGNGGARGLINQNVHPGRHSTTGSSHHRSIASINKLTKASGNNVTLRTIPFGPLNIDSMQVNKDQGLRLDTPDYDQMIHLTANRSNNIAEVYFNLSPQGALFYEDGSGDAPVRELEILYRMELYVVAPGTQPDELRIVPKAPYTGTNQEYAMISYSFGPLDDAEKFIRDATRPVSHNGNGIAYSEDDLTEWMNDYDVFETIVAQAETWNSVTMGEIISKHIEDVFAHGNPTRDQLTALAYQLRYLEQYTVPLESYRAIYQTLHAVAPEDMAHMLAKQNLNLLMSHTLEVLNDLKPQLTQPPAVTPATQNVLPQYVSQQQRQAITTDEPLTLILAGAGCGKSTVILERIEYLAAAGVNQSDITVLSFTNAAADNIKAKNPGVGSMTIASMIHDIYAMNFPHHELSSIDTILNSLDIFYPHSDFARSFRRYLMDVDKNETGAITALNVFIEKYRQETLDVLGSIGQTCLELEIILCYQMIDEMLEPAHVQSKYLIIDEVQDNSIFEFIFTLKYVAKHQENLFIVGDASQTLYEFRAANPKALNTLEGSGVFATYQLTTNYRSNQEILDFANVHLDNIEANDVSKIQLQANSLDQPTAASFQEKVKLNYQQLAKISDFTEEYPTYLHTVVKPYVDECLARGEEVAFLMFTRQLVKITEETLNELYPNEQVANLVSERAFSTTVMSEAIKQFWNDILQLDPANAAFGVTQSIMNNLPQLVRNPDRARNAIQGFISDWWIESANQINSWVNLYQQGGMSEEQFFNNLRTNMLQYEISKNAARQSVLNQKNRTRKEEALASHAKLSVSTVHGAKGLEFDNVVVIHKYTPQTPEDAKRMFYVAFTRAMNTELVLSYGTQKNPHIQTDYDAMVLALEKRDTETALRAQGLDPATASDDEVEAALATFSNTQIKEAKQDQARAETDAATDVQIAPQQPDTDTAAPASAEPAVPTAQPAFGVHLDDGHDTAFTTSPWDTPAGAQDTNADDTADDTASLPSH